jgi:hypothetical protein
MAFILAGDMGVQGAAAAPPPAVETRVAGAPVATGKPFGGWRVVAQSTTTSGGTMGAPGSVSTPANGVSTPGNGSNGTISPSGANGASGTNQAAPDYGSTTGTPAPSMQSAPGTSAPGTSGAGLGGGLTAPNSLPGSPGSTPGSPGSTPGSPSSTPGAPSSTSVPSYGGGTTH